MTSSIRANPLFACMHAQSFPSPKGNGNPLQYSCLENPRDGEAWWAAVYGVAQSRTRLKRLSSSSSMLSHVRLCNPMDCSLPGSSVHGIFQAKILEWVAISYPGILYLIVFKIILRMHGPNSIQLLNFEYRNHSLQFCTQHRTQLSTKRLQVSDTQP